MRPLALRVENFTSFRGVHGPLRFDGLQLFAIAGPTGAGKSSLLDAMLLALYGEVPRTGKQVKELIALGKDQLCVTLDFQRGGEAFRVTRRLFRSTKPTVAQLERLPASALEAGAGLVAVGEALVEGVTAVNDRVQRLLGLDRNAFTQAVILPQGEFARFLKSTPADRQQILGSLLQLLVYGRMRERAQAESKATEDMIATLVRALREDEGVTPEAVAALREELAARLEANTLLEPRLASAEADATAGEQRVRLLGEQDDARRTQLDLELRRREVNADEARLSAARRAAGVVPLLDQADAAEREALRLENEAQRTQGLEARARKAAEDQRHACARALAEAAGLAGLEAQIEALGQVVVLAGPLADAARAVRAAEGVAAERKQALARYRKDKAAKLGMVAAAESAAQEAAAEAAQTVVAVAAAEAALASAEEARRQAEKSDAVAHLRRGLAKGDPCPVCERPLARAPASDAKGDLATLDAVAARAREAQDTLRTRAERARKAAEERRAATERASLAAEAATRDVERASTETLEADERVVEARSAHEARATELSALVRSALAGLPERDAVAAAGAGAAGQPEFEPAAMQARLRRERQQLLSARDAAQAAVESAERALIGAEATASAASRTAAEARSAAGVHAATARQAVQEAQFASAGSARAAGLAPAEQQRLEKAIQDWGNRLHAVQERLLALGGQIAALPPGPSTLPVAQAALAQALHEREALRAEREQGLRDASRLEQQLDSTSKRLARVEQQRAELALMQSRLSLSRQLAEDLKVHRFQAYLLHETLRELVEGASQRLLEVSSGRYALSYAGDDFHVQDHDNAGERRRAETLSGGETFLASLALALELSQQVQKAAGAIHLESLFIDEGFGSLDPETLETVQDAIERLPTGGRMVGVISHLAELTARLPARVVVEKGPAGSSFRVEGA